MKKLKTLGLVGLVAVSSAFGCAGNFHSGSPFKPGEEEDLVCNLRRKLYDKEARERIKKLAVKLNSGTYIIRDAFEEYTLRAEKLKEEVQTEFREEDYVLFLYRIGCSENPRQECRFETQFSNGRKTIIRCCIEGYKESCITARILGSDEIKSSGLVRNTLITPEQEVCLKANLKVEE